jgi:hypothetical protein
MTFFLHKIFPVLSARFCALFNLTLQVMDEENFEDVDMYRSFVVFKKTNFLFFFPDSPMYHNEE